MLLSSRSEAAAVLAAAPGAYVSRYQEADMPGTPYIETVSETANRAAVAIDLADVIEAQARPGRQIDPATIRALPDRGWRLICELAGQPDGYLPSTKTRETVARLIERRNAEVDADPFAGFPS